LPSYIQRLFIPSYDPRRDMLCFRTFLNDFEGVLQRRTRAENYHFYIHTLRNDRYTVHCVVSVAIYTFPT